MEIKYLKSVEQHPTLDGFTNRGLSIEQIRELEDKFNNGKPFPKAFQEYLFLAGDFNNIAFDSPQGLDSLQDEVKRALRAYDKTVDRPYFAFDVIDWNFMVILLDESAEDPKVYLCEPGRAKRNGEPVLRDPEYSFTEIVNEHIKRIKDGTF